MQQTSLSSHSKIARRRVLAWVLRTRFIEGEEQRLMTGFGADYGLWAQRTARWLGRNPG